MTHTYLKTSVVFRNGKFKHFNLLTGLETKKNICKCFILFYFKFSCQDVHSGSFSSCLAVSSLVTNINTARLFVKSVLFCFVCFHRWGKMIEELRKIILTKRFFSSTSHKYRREHNLDHTYKIDHRKIMSPLNPRGFCSFVLKLCKNKTHKNGPQEAQIIECSLEWLLKFKWTPVKVHSPGWMCCCPG